MRGPQRQARGQSLIEFTLCIPILLLLVFGGIDGLQALMTHYIVAWATREAAQQAAIDGGQGEAAEHIARTILENGITDSAKATITIACPEGCRRYAPIRVTITYRDAVWVPLGPWNDLQVNRQVTRASERDSAAADDAAPAAAPLPGGAP